MLDVIQMLLSGVRLGIYLLHSGEIQVLNSDARCGFQMLLSVLDSESICCIQANFRCLIQMLDVDSDAAFRC